MDITPTKVSRPLLAGLLCLFGCQLELDDGLVDDEPCPEGYTCTQDDKSQSGDSGSSDSGSKPDSDWYDDEPLVPETSFGYADGGIYADGGKGYSDAGKGYYDGGYADGGRVSSDSGWDDWDDWPEPDTAPGFSDGGYSDGGRIYIDGGIHLDSGLSDGGIVRPEGGNWFLPDGAITVEDGGGVFCDSGYTYLPEAGGKEPEYDRDAGTASFADGAIKYWHGECGWYFADSGAPPPPGVGQSCLYDSNCREGQYCSTTGECALRW